MIKNLTWEGVKADGKYNENTTIEVLEVDNNFFNKVFSNGVLNEDEYKTLEQYKFKALLKNKDTGEEKAIRTFGLPFALFVAKVI